MTKRSKEEVISSLKDIFFPQNIEIAVNNDKIIAKVAVDNNDHPLMLCDISLDMYDKESIESMFKNI